MYSFPDMWKILPVFCLTLLGTAFITDAEARQSFSSEAEKVDSLLIKIPNPKDYDVCGDIWKKHVPKSFKGKKKTFPKSVTSKVPARFRSIVESVSFKPEKLFKNQCNSYKKKLVDSITTPFVLAKKQLNAAKQTIWTNSLIELRKGFYSWVAWTARDYILPTLSAKEKEQFQFSKGTSAQSLEKAYLWLNEPEREIEAYVKVYLKKNHAVVSAVYEKYLNFTGEQSQQIIKGFGAILTDAQKKLGRIGKTTDALQEPTKRKTPYAKILKDGGFSGEWLDNFKAYEGDFNILDKQYDIIASSSIIVKSFQTKDPSAKIDVMFELLDSLSGTAANSHLPIVSLFGDIVQAYVKVGKEMLAAVNVLGNTLRKRSGYCIGTGVPIGRKGVNRYTEAKQYAVQFTKNEQELICPLGHGRYPFKHIYEATELPSGRLFFWDGYKFIVGSKDGGGKPGVLDSIKIITEARSLNYQMTKSKKDGKGVKLLPYVYNTPFAGGTPALMLEAREVMGGLTKLIHKLEPALGKTSDECNPQDLWDYLKVETRLDVNAFQKELAKSKGSARQSATYAASYVAKNGGFGKKNKARGNAYGRYKKTWDKIKEFNIRKVSGRVVNKNNTDASCPECGDAELEITIHNGLQIPGCEIKQADEQGKFLLRVVTQKSTFSIDMLARVQGHSSEHHTVTEDHFKRWDEISLELPVPLNGKNKEIKEQTQKEQDKQEEKTEQEPIVKTLLEPDPDAEPPEQEKEPADESQTESSETEQDKKTGNAGSTSPSVKVGDTVTFPDVVGMSLMDAVAALKAVGLFAQPEVGRSALNPDDVGKVEVAFPAKDGEVHAGDQIIIRVFDEAVDSGNVPNTIGMKLAEAADAIKLAGFNPVFELGDETSDPKKDATIASQAPAPGLEIEAGKDVTLIVYTLAVETRTVPNLDGMGLKAAQDKLKSNDLFITPLLEEAASKKSDEGKVYKQYPEPGLDVMKGIAISVWVYGEVETTEAHPKITSNPSTNYTSSGGVPYIDLPALSSFHISELSNPGCGSSQSMHVRSLRVPRTETNFQCQGIRQMNVTYSFEPVNYTLTSKITMKWIEPGDRGNNNQVTFCDSKLNPPVVHTNQINLGSGTMDDTVTYLWYKSKNTHTFIVIVFPTSTKKQHEKLWIKTARKLMQGIEPYAKPCN